MHDGMQYDLIKVKVTSPSKLEIRPFSKAVFSAIYNRRELATEGKKERKLIYIATFSFIYYVYSISQSAQACNASHSFTCKYTMPAFPSYAFTRWRHL